MSELDSRLLHFYVGLGKFFAFLMRGKKFSQFPSLLKIIIYGFCVFYDTKNSWNILRNPSSKVLKGIELFGFTILLENSLI